MGRHSLSQLILSSEETIATYPNIVGSNTLRAFGHPVATGCDMLRGVVCCWLKFENGLFFYATFMDVA